MRCEQNVSSFVVEALDKDTDSTFWDYPVIERILEAGADPDLVGPGRLIALDRSNKSDQDVQSIRQLLSKYGISIGIELEPLYRFHKITIADCITSAAPGMFVNDASGAINYRALIQV
jgi:hypothetical protein